MGLLKHFKSRSRIKSQHDLPPYPYPKRGGTDQTLRLPVAVLKHILSFVAPHTLDESYEVSEKSILGGSCVLCDIRDLANCASVSRLWRRLAQDLLYRCVRIDAVHFCGLENALSDQRKRSKIDPLDIPVIRLRLLERTLRGSPELAASGFFVKLPFTTRETCKSELARIVSVLPNLQYVDLPESFYSAHPSCQILRDCLAAESLELRKMIYSSGAEEAFESSIYRQPWTMLEVLELDRLDVEPTMIRNVLGTLPVLQDATLRELPRLDDTLFQPTPSLPDFQPLKKLTLEEAPRLTTNGLLSYVSRLEVRENLSHLSLKGTGVTVPTLHAILSQSVALRYLSVSETVTRAFPLDPVPPLSSRSLRTLDFEVTPSPSTEQHTSAWGPVESYYSYLAMSLQANSLPSLRKLYVRNSDFAEKLLLVPPQPTYAPGGSQHPPQARGFDQPLEIYAKGDAELDWVYTSFESLSVSQSEGVDRPGSGGNARIGRPVSAYDVTKMLGSQWSGQARKSVMVGNGVGGFLAVPPSAQEEPSTALRPSSARVSQERPPSSRGTRGDLWR